MKASQQAFDLIKKYEGCKLKAYKCPAGKWTVGYGQTGSNITKETVWTLEQAEEALKKTVAVIDTKLAGLIRVTVTQNQYDALVSFVYNLGTGALAGSRLLRELNAGRAWTAAKEFGKWTHVGIVELPGLVRRRAEECALFVRV